MDKNLHDIDKLFYDSVEPHEEAPSAKVWDEIDKNLTKKGYTNYKKKYDRLKWLMLLLLVFTTILVTYLLKQNNNPQKNNSSLDQTLTNNNTPEVPSTPSGDKQNTISPLVNKTQEGPDSVTNKKDAEAPPNENIVHNNKPSSALQENKTAAIETKNKKTISGTTNNISIPDPINSAAAKKNKINPGEKTTYTQSQPTTPINNNVVITTSGGKTSRFKKNKPGDDKAIAENHLIDNNPNKNNPDSTKTSEDPYPIFSVRNQNYPLSRSYTFRFPTVDNSFTNTNLSASPLAIAAQQKRAAGLKRIQRGSAISIIPYIMPLFSTLHVEEGHHIHREDDREAIRERENDSNGKPVLSFGIMTELSLNKHISIQTGAGYYSSSSQIKPQTIYAHQDPNRGGGNAYKFNCTAGSVYFNTKTLNTNPVSGDSLEALNPSVKLNYLQIPLLLRYDLLAKNKVKLFADAGVYTNILAKSNVELTLTNGNAKENLTASNIDGLRKINYSWVIGAGIEYSLTNKLGIFGNVNSNTSLTPINKNTPVKTNVSNVGVQMGLKIRL